MTHIKTASSSETLMRKSYPVSRPEAIRADADIQKTLEHLKEATRKLDLLKAEISEDMGRIMVFMREADTLQDDTGHVLVQWKTQSDRTSVDYAKLLLDLNVPPQKIAQYTNVTTGPRTFKVLD